MMRSLQRFIPIPVYRLLISCIALLGSIALFPVYSPVAHAYSSTTGTYVVIARDATSKDCVITKIVGVGTPRAKTTTSRCLPGTVMHRVAVLKSEAIAQHKDYVDLPPANAPQEIQSQTQQKIYQLMLQEKTALQPHTVDHARAPFTTCADGNETLWTNVAATMKGNRIDSSVQWNVSSDCSTIVIDYGAIQLLSVEANQLWWGDMEYKGWAFWDVTRWPGTCAEVGPQYQTYTSYPAEPSPVQPAGKDYYHGFSERAGCSNNLNTPGYLIFISTLN